MNDVEYLLRQDAREKKAAGRGIYHKHSGAKSKYVSLPSDHLTAAQKKRRNGEVKTYNISKCITSYAEFKALPHDLAQEYIDNVQSTYHASLSMIAASMHVTRPTLQSYLRDHNIRTTTKDVRKKTDPRWTGFFFGELTTTGKPVTDTRNVVNDTDQNEGPSLTLVNVSEEKTTAPAPAITKADVSRIILSGSGTPDALLDLLMTAFADLTKAGTTYEFSIELAEKGGEV